MKAAVCYGPGEIRLEEVPRPEVGRDEVLVRLAACGVCQSDLKKIFHPAAGSPRIHGHEMAGWIEEAGPEVEGWQVGERVVVLHHVPCFHCRYCLEQLYSLCPVYREVTTTAGYTPSGGGFAEFVRVPGHLTRHGLIRIPASVHFEEATFVEPVNCCLKALRKGGVRPGERVLVTGAGPIGLLLVQLLREQGARPLVSELRADRRAQALAYGAGCAVDPTEPGAAESLREAAGGRGVDLALLAVPGASPLDFASTVLRGGGRLLFFAEAPEDLTLPLRPNWIYRQELTLLGSYSSSYALQELSAEIVFERRIETRALITDRYPLAQLPAAVDLARQPRTGTLKVLIEP